MTPRGWTLHEMIISLAVTGVIVTLAGSAALGQLRFFRGVGEIITVRTQVGQAATIAANVLRDVAAPSDLHVALDSAVEASVTIGSAVTCRADTGQLTVPAGDATAGNSLGAYAETPQAGDVAHVLISDSSGAGWITAGVASAPSGATCLRFPWAGRAWILDTSEPFVFPEGAPVRFTRRTRLSLYRASDNQWYLGLRDWNSALNRFNTIQPVAGPLRPYSSSTALSGFSIEYRDSTGALLPPGDRGRVALITVLARGNSRRPARVAGIHSTAAPFYHDSAVVSVAIRLP
jgi:hypothetical protein